MKMHEKEQGKGYPNNIDNVPQGEGYMEST